MFFIDKEFQEEAKKCVDNLKKYQLMDRAHDVVTGIVSGKFNRYNLFDTTLTNTRKRIYSAINGLFDN